MPQFLFGNDAFYILLQEMVIWVWSMMMAVMIEVATTVGGGVEVEAAFSVDVEGAVVTIALSSIPSRMVATTTTLLLRAEVLHCLSRLNNIFGRPVVFLSSVSEHRSPWYNDYWSFLQPLQAVVVVGALVGEEDVEDSNQMGRSMQQQQ